MADLSASKRVRPGKARAVKLDLTCSGSTQHNVWRHRAPSSQRAAHGAVKREVFDTELDAAARTARSVDRGGDICTLTGTPRAEYYLDI